MLRCGVLVGLQDVTPERKERNPLALLVALLGRSDSRFQKRTTQLGSSKPVMVLPLCD